MSPASMELHLRVATTADLATLVALDSVAASDPQRAVQIHHWLAAGYVHIAERDGASLGYRVLHRQFFGEAFVAMLMVASGQRRQGVASALLSDAIAAQGHAKLFTSTNQSNMPMQGLLQRSGFEQCGIVHGLDEGDPELIYRYVRR